LHAYTIFVPISNQKEQTGSRRSGLKRCGLEPKENPKGKEKAPDPSGKEKGEPKEQKKENTLNQRAKRELWI
jgi:hypothetical protein